MSATYSRCQGTPLTRRKRGRCSNGARPGTHTCWHHRGQESSIVAVAEAAAVEDERRWALEEAQKATGQRIIICDGMTVSYDNEDTIKERFGVRHIKSGHGLSEYRFVLYGVRYYDTEIRENVLYLSHSPDVAERDVNELQDYCWQENSIYSSTEDSPC